MQTSDIKVGVSYTGSRWKGDRKVTQVIRHRGQKPLVHFIDLRTGRTGNAPLSVFAASANGLGLVASA